MVKFVHSKPAQDPFQTSLSLSGPAWDLPNLQRLLSGLQLLLTLLKYLQTFPSTRNLFTSSPVSFRSHQGLFGFPIYGRMRPLCFATHINLPGLPEIFCWPSEPLHNTSQKSLSGLPGVLLFTKISFAVPCIDGRKGLDDETLP